jgi:uncharacterized protein YdaU (DUF1376 family)
MFFLVMTTNDVRLAMNYFQFHIGDYKSATSHLSNEEDLAYRRLLDMYYDTESPIPLETQWVARRIRMDCQVVDLVLKDMFLQTQEGWRHSRCDQVIADYHAMAEKNRANGRLGGRKKNPMGSQVLTDSQPIAKATINQEPRTINQEPLTKENPQDKPADDLFDLFWKAYPKKMAKDAAKKAFTKRNVGKQLLHEILMSLEQHKKTDQWKKDGGQFIPAPATWLNQGRWQDEVFPVQPNSTIGAFI